MDANQFNMNMANKKAAIGDELALSASNYNPQYFAGQSATQTANRDAAGWMEMEKRLRAQGYGDEYINAEKNRFNVGSSQNYGTAYDRGWQTGQANRTSTYQAAGGMYGQVAVPNAGLTSNYLDLYNTSKDSANAAGQAIQDAFKINDVNPRKRYPTAEEQQQQQ
jgi:hypothetical protein